MTDRELLEEARDLFILCTLIDKSGNCKAMVDKIDTYLLSISNNSDTYSQDEKKELCKQLRIETGNGLMECKKALNESGWNMEKAKGWLQQFRKRPYIYL